MGSSRQARSYSWLGEASHFFYILYFHRQKGVFITIIEKIISFVYYFQKRKRQLYKMSAKTGDFRIQMRITGVENAKTYIPQFTLVDFEQSLKQKQSKDKSKPFC